MNKKPITINEPEKAYIALKPYSSRKQEHFFIITLNGSHQIKKIHTIFKGTINKCIVHPREIFHMAIKDLSAGIICAHNHPSGNLNPSQEDIDIYKKLKECAKILDIPIVDNLIITKNGYYSFLEHKQLKEAN